MPTTQKPIKAQCMDWLENPQVSEVGKAYALGNADPKSKWKQLMTGCKTYMEEYFTSVKEKFYDPAGFIAIADEIITAGNTLDGRDKSATVANRLNQAIVSCENVEEVKAYVSSLIIAFGLVVEDHNWNRNASLLQQRKQFLYQTYLFAVDRIGRKFPDINFLSLDEFKQLDNAAFTNRTTVKKEVVPTPPPKCAVPKNDACASVFGRLAEKNKLAEEIKCNCNFFKQKLVTVKGKETLTDKKQLGAISKEDKQMIKETHGIRLLYPKPTIAIRKYPSNACREKDYLSQLFTKVCSLFPTELKPLAQTEESIIATNLLNATFTTSGIKGYYGRNLDIFQTDIQGPDQMTNVPVYFVNDDNTFYPDLYTGPTKQFFSDVMAELLLHGVFTYSSTYFNNVRYILNPDFKISKMPFYKELPAVLRTEKLTEYFYLFLGNLIHFAVANNIELPFKLSRAYIIKLFNLMTFDRNTDRKTKIVLVSILLIEQPSSYTDAVLKLMEDPKDEEALAIVGILYDTDGFDMEKDILEYLYMTALEVYFPKDDRVSYFFNGFTYYREYHETDADFKQLMKYELPDNTPLEVRLALVRKYDLYLSGAGLTYEKIREDLIPQIGYILDDTTYRFNQLDQILKSVPNRLKEADGASFTNLQETITYWLYRILLNKGLDMPADFKEALKTRFNLEGLTDEEYHHEFVKILLKTWTGVPYVMSGTLYKVFFGNVSNRLPTTHTCFNQMDIHRMYRSPMELYNDLLALIIETNFGEALAGGKKMKNNKPNKNNNHGGKKEKARVRSSGSARKQKA